MKYFVMFCVYAAFGTAYGLYHIMDTMTYYRYNYLFKNYYM